MNNPSPIDRRSMRIRVTPEEHALIMSQRAGSGIGPLAPSDTDKFAISDNGDGLTIESVSDRIRTIEDAIAYAEVDLAIWEVAQSKISSWEVSMKIRQGDGSDKPVSRHLWKVAVVLRRKAPKPIQEAILELIDRVKQHAPKYPKIILPKVNRQRHLLEIALYDSHFGKLAWAEETGTNYDLRISEAVYLKAVQDLLAKASHYRFNKIVFPVGQDFFHVNNAANTTARGTPQDVDGRLKKVFRVGTLAVTRAIEYCRAIAPVDVIWVPGNHDPDTSFFLAEVIGATFRNCKDVNVDSSPASRKIFTYGQNGIMLTHGDEEPHRDLPVIMAAEDRMKWAATVYNEIHTGHFHKKKEVRFTGADTFGGGVVVRTIGSLSGCDDWHYRKGWNKSPRSAEAFVWGEAPGLEAYFSTHDFSSHA